jgi:hypothetical protein
MRKPTIVLFVLLCAFGMLQADKGWLSTQKKERI